MPKKIVKKTLTVSKTKSKTPVLKKTLKAPFAGWSLLEHGVTQTLLAKFKLDTDRFHKRTILGLKEIDRKEAMEYGTIFHKLIELGSSLGSKFTREKHLALFTAYMSKYDSQESLLLCRIALLQYHEYLEWNKDKPQYTPIEQEPVFREPILLPPLNFNPSPDISIRIPSGITIPLRGRIDGVIENNGMWIEENKTKSRINISVLQDTIHANLQVMFYAVCSELKYKRPCKGIIYNIIRKPGQRIRQKESERGYLSRIQEEIQKDPSYYFYRLQYELPPNAVAKWKKEELFPLLYQVYIWWRSIEKNPLDPWQDINGNVNPFHGRRSFGIYDPMSDGKGDLYDLIVYGNKRNLVVDTELFPELQEEDE